MSSSLGSGPLGTPDLAQLTNSCKFLEGELLALRAEHEALIHCLDKAGVLPLLTLQKECQQRCSTPGARKDKSRERSRSVRSEPEKVPDKEEQADSSTGNSFESDLYSFMQPLLEQADTTADPQNALRSVQRLLKSSSQPPNCWTGPGTPLNAAVRAQRADVVRLLLRARATVNVRDAKGVSALHSSAFDGNVELCRLLLMSRADVNSCDRHGQTPLFFAPTRDMCKVLAERSADVNILNRKGQSALHLAGRAGLTEVLGWLSGRVTTQLAELKDAHGCTARSYAQQALQSMPKPAPKSPPAKTSPVPKVGAIPKRQASPKGAADKSRPPPGHPRLAQDSQLQEASPPEGVSPSLRAALLNDSSPRELARPEASPREALPREAPLTERSLTEGSLTERETPLAERSAAGPPQTSPRALTQEELIEQGVMLEEEPETPPAGPTEEGIAEAHEAAAEEEAPPPREEPAQELSSQEQLMQEGVMEEEPPADDAPTQEAQIQETDAERIPPQEEPAEEKPREPEDAAQRSSLIQPIELEIGEDEECW